MPLPWQVVEHCCFWLALQNEEGQLPAEVDERGSDCVPEETSTAALATGAAAGCVNGLPAVPACPAGVTETPKMDADRIQRIDGTQVERLNMTAPF